MFLVFNCIVHVLLRLKHIATVKPPRRQQDSASTPYRRLASSARHNRHTGSHSTSARPGVGALARADNTSTDPKLLCNGYFGSRPVLRPEGRILCCHFSQHVGSSVRSSTFIHQCTLPSQHDCNTSAAAAPQPVPLQRLFWGNPKRIGSYICQSLHTAATATSFGAFRRCWKPRSVILTSGSARISGRTS